MKLLYNTFSFKIISSLDNTLAPKMNKARDKASPGIRPLVEW